MELPIEVKYTRPLISIQDMVNFIDKGEKYLKTGTQELSEEQQLEVLQGIILSPDYQREYRSKSKEETSIIESIIVGIPIPEIFLVRTSNQGVLLRHVMDGQHRLTAIYRYVKDKFALTDLDLLKDDEEFKNKKFSQLSRDNKIKILGNHLSILEFETFSDDEMEIELFKRYNRNTKPLEKHEMSMATYYSNTSLFITNFLNKNIEDQNDNEYANTMVRIYNITSDRKNKQKNHQEICIILNIINYGPNFQNKDGVEIADKFLQQRAAMYKSDQENDLQQIKEKFNLFNDFMNKLSKEIEYPFSSAIYRGGDKRSTKYHTGVSIILAIIFYYFNIELEKRELLSDIQRVINLSPLGDETYNASSTNTRKIMKYLYIDNKVFSKKYNALTYKENLSEDIIRQLEKITEEKNL